MLDKPNTAKIDPITFEVIRNKLQAITEEQAITLKAVSGSPVVTEATDFNNGLYLNDGSIVTMGPQVIFHTGTMSTVIRSIIENFSENPGIKEGDMFILNDPYRGAIHQPDVSIVAPVFYQGRQVAWAGSCAHQLDVGGMSFGSWAIGGTEIQQEAMLLPGVKLVEGGVLRQDLWQMIMGMTRLPHVLGLDLKAMIAANNVAARRLVELMDRYGADTVRMVMIEEINTSERQIRQTLSKLPDGVFRARDYIEHDGNSDILYQVCVTATKKGDSLTLDMTGTSPQAPGFINCTASGMRGAAMTGLLPILAPNIRWNEGVIRAVRFVAPDGILCNASWPAPISAGTISAAWIVQNVVVAALSRMVACSPAYASEGQAVTKGHMMVMTLAGRDRDGGPFGTFLLDSTPEAAAPFRITTGSMVPATIACRVLLSRTWKQMKRMGHSSISIAPSFPTAAERAAREVVPPRRWPYRPTIPTVFTPCCSGTGLKCLMRLVSSADCPARAVSTSFAVMREIARQ
jgi:N-methylhydantoinase B